MSLPKGAAPPLRAHWGDLDGKEVELFTLTNANGLTAKITNYGALLVELHVPDRAGQLGDIVLGYDNLADYLTKSPYFGATVGRVANRIAHGKFQLGAETYTLATNNGPNHLHGGTKGWDKVVWSAETQQTDRGPAVNFSYMSQDGEEGYPGTVTATARYTLTNDNELVVEMGATTDATTLVNMAHHSYFNLSAGQADTVLQHLLTLSASQYTPGMPPDGRVVSVESTPFDFRTPKAVGRDLEAAGSAGGDAPVGYDSNWIVDGDPGKMRLVARLKDPGSGRVMTLEANQPGVQFYSGCFLDGSTKGKGRVHHQYGALALETQAFPNAINVPEWKRQVVLEPGRVYQHTMIHRFSTE